MNQGARAVVGRAGFIVMAMFAGVLGTGGCASDGDPVHRDFAVVSNAWTRENPLGTVAISEAVVFWVAKTVPKGDESFTRQVFRYRVDRLPLEGDARPYWLRFTGKVQTGQLTTAFETRPRPVARPAPAAPRDEDTEEMGMAMPETGVVVVNGTAPLIAVKKATVSSIGTTFAIEANSSDWLLTVLATDGDHKVLVHFPESRVLAKELAVGESIRYGNGATTPEGGTREDGSPAANDLRDYANWILSQTP